MPIGDQFGLAGDGDRLIGELDLGLFDGEHELGLVGRIEDIVAGLLEEAVGQEIAEDGIEIVAAELADALARRFPRRRRDGCAGW